jgi:hypothetical protein
MSLSVDTSELYALSRDLGKTGAKSALVMYGVFKEGGKDLETTWKRNAKATSGQHGKRYPDSITTDMHVSTNIEVEVGPDPQLPQGGMSFEFGSVNQPPHLDGQMAADEVVPRIDRRIDAALAHLGL